MKNLYLLLVLVFISCNNKKENHTTNKNKKADLEVLLIGTSHWNNYKSKGADIAQTDEIDILSDKYQKELNEIIDKIIAFKPDKIFVERTVFYQPKLDSLYNLYKYKNWGRKYRNEIYQLGFKTATILDHDRVYGVDYRETSFPYGKLMRAMKDANQQDLIRASEGDLKQFESRYNKLIAEKKHLKEILYFLNSKEQRKLDLDWYLNNANKGGSLEETTGSFLASEWIKRNIYTYGFIQKYVSSKDKKIMIIMGSSHIAVLDNLISYNKNWQTVELKDIIEN
ncbi:hypothetical protein JL193_00860 [Polaribacter batillariae]|uniref:Haem-binding uptake, Tiki superfamily, ChaN n=1 Tax=Polaribacter batillariae TaxID=2808900 RepID=A0ABX7SY34_9FLAO|nr:DUF5694 domain-containing protein [Polaribacter batillariae]QTD37891.1 hypothetical protein JL193_00860 [Polaribacter batillariae]